MADIDDIYNLLNGSLPQIKSDLAMVKTEVTSVKKVAESNQRSLTGTDDKPGLVHKVNTLCTGQSQIRVMVVDHEKILYKGRSDTEPGLVSQSRDIRKFRSNLIKWYWLFIGAIVVGVINIVLQFVTLPWTVPGG